MFLWQKLLTLVSTVPEASHMGKLQQQSDFVSLFPAIKLQLPQLLIYKVLQDSSAPTSRIKAAISEFAYV